MQESAMRTPIRVRVLSEPLDLLLPLLIIHRWVEYYSQSGRTSLPSLRDFLLPRFKADPPSDETLTLWALDAEGWRILAERRAAGSYQRLLEQYNNLGPRLVALN